MDHNKQDGQVLEHLSPVERMFHGRSVFITGASGFIGRVLLEKLLRCYPGIRRIYLLMRTKKGQQPADRLHKQLLSVPIFDAIKARQDWDELLAKLVVVPGDIGQPKLGIAEQDLQQMLDDPTLGIVIHSAATIKFDEPLKVSVQLNLVATREILSLCRRLPNLISLCHVSTAYVNSHLKDNSDIEERLYPMSEKPEQLMRMAECMDERLMQELKVRLVDQRPNTYTYTKALAEHLILEEAQDLPVAIVRPSIVVGAWKEPLPGWIDNLNGPTGIIIAVSKGLIHTLHALRDIKAEIVPVDVVVNTMIASTYFAATNWRERQLGQLPAREMRDDLGRSEPRIFHCNSGDRNPITWGQVEDYYPVIRKFPSAELLRYPGGSYKSSRLQDLWARLLAHYLPALIIDLICLVTGRKRMMLTLYRRIHTAIDALAHFRTTNYNFKTRNLSLLEAALAGDERDSQTLYLDLKPLDWFEFWHDYVLGARRWVLREPDETLGEARRSLLRAYYLDLAFRLLLVLLLVGALVWPLAGRLLRPTTMAGAGGASVGAAFAAEAAL